MKLRFLNPILVGLLIPVLAFCSTIRRPLADVRSDDSDDDVVMRVRLERTHDSGTGSGIAAVATTSDDRDDAPNLLIGISRGFTFSINCILSRFT